MIGGRLGARDIAEALCSSAGSTPRQSGGRWQAPCPVHDDKHASFTVVDGDAGPLVTCHAGCERDAIIYALRQLGLWGERGGASNGNGHAAQPPRKKSGRIVATYSYRDEAGALLFEVVRFEPKDFKQRRPDGAGGWAWKLGDVRRVLYRLPELLAADPAETVYVVEGEKSVDRLRSLGFAATCSPHGAGKWKPAYGDPLRGRDVRILPDADAPGRKHAEAVAAALTGVAASVRIVELPALSEHQDVCDWLDYGGTASGLAEIAERAPEWTAPRVEAPAAGAPVASDNGRGTELWFARLLVAEHSVDLRFVGPWKAWMVYNEAAGIWARDESGEVMRRAKAIAERVLDEALQVLFAAHRAGGADAIKDADKVVESARKWWSRRALEQAIALASTEPEVVATPQQWDADPWILHVANGAFDLRSGALGEPKREHYATRKVAVPYVEDAAAPTFEKVLIRAQPDIEARCYLRRALGSALIGLVREEVLHICHGSGANGKSTILEGVLYALGHYALSVPGDMLLEGRRATEMETYLAGLHGRRYVLAGETKSGRKLAEERVKMLTGGDEVTGARRLYEMPFSFRPSHSFWAMTNHTPRISDCGEGMWRRIILVPWNTVIPVEERDPTLKPKVREPLEQQGILRWLIDGAREYLRDGLATPKSILAATAEYRSKEDLIGEFIATNLREVAMIFTSSAAIHARWMTWCEDQGVEPRARIGQRALTDALTDRGLRYEKTRGPRGFRGVTLADES